MRLDLSEQVALVTGSAHRVGRAIALELAKAGMHIQVHYHSAEPEVVRDTLHEIKAHGVNAFAVQADISTPEGVQATMDALMSNFGRVHVLVNSASVFPSASFLDVTLESWEQTMNVNLRAPFLLTQAVARLMLANDPQGGSIINILDKGASQAWAKRPHHGISKAGLWALTQVSALSLAPHIRVNGVLAGPVIKTNDGMSDDTWLKMGQALPIGRTGEGMDVGRAVVFLASESFITGALLHVNGGEHL
jgi:pteridine reductase